MQTNLSSPLSIIADDRERGGGVIPALQNHPQVSLTIQRLPLGDNLIDDRILIERKSWNDFSASIIDGRLFRQASRLASQPKRAVLIIEGATEYHQDGLKHEAIQGALITVSVFYGIPLLRSRNTEETARLILYIGRQNHSFRRFSLPRSGRRPHGKRKQQLYILQGLPGIGPVRAERLLAQFGSLQAVFKASPEALQEVKGIGKKDAQKIGDIIKESPGAYGDDDVFVVGAD